MSVLSNPIHFDALSNVVRDLGDEFSAILSSQTDFLSLIGEVDRKDFRKDGKLEWLEDVEVPEQDTLNNGGAVLAADTTFVVSNVTYFQVGMVVKFRDEEETMLVTAINTGTSTLTVTRAFNGLPAPTTVADSSVIMVVNRAVAEYNRANLNSGVEPTVEYNYWETFREDIAFSKMVADAKQYGFDGKDAFIGYQLERFMRKIRARLARSVIWGERNVGGAGVPSRMRGVYTALRQAGTNKSDAGGAAITATMLNNLLASIFDDDQASMKNIVLYTSPIIARTMASFNVAVANRMETVGFDSKIASGATSVTLFHSDLEATGMPKLIVDTTAPAGALMALNTDKIKIAYGPDGRLQQWDSKPKDARPQARQIAVAMDASLIMKDHKQSHGLIYNAKKVM